MKTLKISRTGDCIHMNVAEILSSLNDSIKVFNEVDRSIISARHA